MIGEAYPGKGYLAECPGVTGWVPLDVTRNATLELVLTIWTELTRMFPDKSVFLGGDECHTECWGDNAAISAWTEARNLTATGSGAGSLFQWYASRLIFPLVIAQFGHDTCRRAKQRRPILPRQPTNQPTFGLLPYLVCHLRYIKEVITMVAGSGKVPMMWSPLAWDSAAPPFGKDAILNIWTGNVAELVYNISATNQLVTSFNWYLPAGGAYASDPQGLCSGENGGFECDAVQLANIIGGEACLWGEGIDRGNFFTSAWPDLTAVAERLWSPKVPQGGLDLLDGDRRRLRVHRCRLASRGLPLAPMSAVYVPDASHASFARWRKDQWCDGDHTLGYTPDPM